MDNYIVSARKYRPADFQSVIGQKSLATTLKNAIMNNKLAHAYLFCGPRGVGKTTCARIFAKTINCFHPGADGDACNECESCRYFNENRSLNIHELDAASNNSVDDIRALTEQVRIPPQLGKYKVYIIDEVHMLSQAAFNAFLKTLEEPPHHAVFILATTEKHKILPTILSRCQIYEFNRININDIVDYLEYVATKENVSFEREALNVIAQKADGGMRDALSIFDQVVSFSQGNVTYKTVIENLNVLDYDYYFRLTDTILENKVGQNLLLLNEILSRGFDGQQILSGFSLFFRDLMVCKDPQTIVLFETGDAVKSRYLELAARCDTNFLYKAIELTNDADLNYRYSRNKRLFIELLLIRLCQLNGQPASEDEKKKQVIEPIVENVEPRPKPVQETSEEKAPHPPASVPNGEHTSFDKSSEKAIARVSLKKTPESENNEKQAEMTDNQVFSTPFSQEELQAGWKNYTNSLDDIHLKNAMLYIVPKLLDDFKIEITVLNQEQFQKLQEKGVEIKNFLFAQLKNNRIALDIKIAEEDSKQNVFTEKEKLLYLMEKNPQLTNLVKEFNLRLD
ncbi:DNA polymerase III subunit gamma/tau [Bacteroidia bacterium]|nr:DNA polymerase III subunit gamma/tau [Bacteroidia bacterium]